jgi:hypothetical protein
MLYLINIPIWSRNKDIGQEIREANRNLTNVHIQKDGKQICSEKKNEVLKQGRLMRRLFKIVRKRRTKFLATKKAQQHFERHRRREN